MGIGDKALKERDGGDHGGRNGKAFGECFGRVARRVQLGDHFIAGECAWRAAVEICLMLRHGPGHLENALGIVGDRPERIHRQNVAGRSQQSQPGQCNSIRREQCIAAK